MIPKQYYLGCLAHGSYPIADESSGEAAVVDPQRDVDWYAQVARRLGCRIGHVFLTLWGAKIRCAPREICDLHAGH